MRWKNRDPILSRRACREGWEALRLRPGLAVGALAVLFCASACSLLGPLVMRRLIDEGITWGNGSRLGLFAVIFLAVEALRTLAEASQTVFLRALSQKTSGQIRKKAFGHLQRLPLGWFDMNPPGAVVTLVTQDAVTLGEAFSTGLVTLFKDVLIFAGVTSILLALDRKLGLITLGTTLLVGIPALVLRRSATRLAEAAVSAQARMNSVLEENIAGHRVIRLFAIESARFRRFEEESHGFVRLSLSTLKHRVLYDAGASVTSALALTVVIALGGRDLAAHRLSVGLFVAILQYGSSLMGTLRGTAEKAVTILSGIAAGSRIFELLDVSPGLPAFCSSPALEDRSERGLVLRDLHFGYRPGHAVLRGIFARIARGERIALVGKTGAGKTTLARLLARLYDPWQGDITLEGRNLKSISGPELRRDVAFVPQHISLFRETILENIRLGRSEIGREEVISACREVGLHRFIERLPAGYDTILGEGGIQLSAGERQLLSCARVLVRDPKVVILDEPTANVDPETEEEVLIALGRLLEKRTAIVIAHRFSTLRKADRVFVMDSGTLLEEGPFLELCARPGTLQDLLRRIHVASARRV